MNQDMNSSFLEESRHEVQHIKYEQALQKIKELETYVDALAKRSLSLEKKLLEAKETDEESFTQQSFATALQEMVELALRNR